MYGFYIYKNIDQKLTQKYHPNDAVLSSDDFVFYYKRFEKFSNDKVFVELNNFIIGFDGVLLNKNSLISPKNTTLSETLINLYKTNGIQFINGLKGEFSGFVFEITQKRLFVFTNKTATKQVFYYHDKQYFISTPTTETIIKIREHLGLTNQFNTQQFYNYLTFFSLFDNHTLVNDVYKIVAGKYIELQNQNILKKTYYDYNHINIEISDEKKAIEKLDYYFSKALDLEYQKDIEYNYKHLATLSGGLDSRMNVMNAVAKGYLPDTFCFSQRNYLDHTISQKITNNFKLKHSFYDLDTGNYLLNVDKMLEINNGLQFYIGSAHYHHTLQKVDLEPYGLIHTGQIGDGILGGFVTKDKTKGYLSKVSSKIFLHKINVSQQFLSQFRDEEIFKLYQRVFNLTNFGSYATEDLKTYLVSPFFDSDFIEVALSIHPDLKFNEKIYIKWINQLHPNITHYIWERTRMKPNKTWKTELSYYTNFAYAKYLKITNQKNRLSMNPIEFWWDTNQNLRDFYHHFFEQNINQFIENKELYSDAVFYYKNGNVLEKSTLITLLAYIKKNNLKV